MPKKTSGTHKVVRDTRSGKFVKKEMAERRPSTTVTETVANTTHAAEPVEKDHVER